MPETRFTEFPALSVARGLGSFRLDRRPMTDYFCYLPMEYLQLMLYDSQLQTSFEVFRYAE